MAVDDRRQTNVEGDTVVVNMAIVHPMLLFTRNA